MQLTYKMESFEGPLDLLLDLIHKNKMDILDIQISVIFEQYMAHLERMRQMDMEIAGEFIVMASELMLIKSNMLLPREEETEEDPRARLAQALLAYQQAKAAADYLAEQYGLFGGRMTKDTDEIPADTQLENQDVRLLERTLMRLLRKKERDLTPPMEMITPIIKKVIVPVSEKIRDVVNQLSRRGTTSFVSLFDNASSKSEVVALFMAVLELIKDGSILLEKRIGALPDTWNPDAEYDEDRAPYEFYCTLNHEKDDWETGYEPAG